MHTIKCRWHNYSALGQIITQCIFRPFEIIKRDELKITLSPDASISTGFSSVSFSLARSHAENIVHKICTWRMSFRYHVFISASTHSIHHKIFRIPSGRGQKWKFRQLLFNLRPCIIHILPDYERERESNHLIFHHFLFRSSIIHSVLRAFFLPFRFQIKNRQKQHQRGKKRKWWKKKVKMNWRVYEGERFIIKFKEPKQACTRCWAKDKSGQTESHIRERVSARALK